MACNALRETYLLRAEARFRQGNLAGAADDINKLRDRAFKEYRASSGNPNAGKVSKTKLILTLFWMNVLVN